MRRQGRQHGMVRTYPILSAPLNPRPRSRNLNELASPPTAGLFTKVSSKPTNHSKFTGKCGRPKCNDCHIHPACKSRDKAKGASKMRASSDVSAYRLITWRVVDAAPGFRGSGFSAKGVLDYLDSGDYDDDHGYDATEYGDGDGDGDGYDEDECYDHREMTSSHGVRIEEVDEMASSRGVGIEEVEDEDGMSFCEVGFVWGAAEGDESWCLVEEM